jgi:alkanesulfonate monooxygenase SsuD/methylene tetrahydromethanopterin reductase-like flavin-dependent oxidoreductase (luciferase family)
MAIVHKDSRQAMKNYTRVLREALVKADRDPYSCKIFFSIRPWLAATEAEAKERMLQNAEQARVEDGLGRLSYLLGHDFSQYDLDKPLPQDLPVSAMLGHLLQFTEEESGTRTIRQIAKKEAAREDMPIYGSADQVADFLGELADEVDADGFHFRYATKDFPYIVQVTSELIPALQKRGLFRTEYAGSTLREHLFGPQICNR